MHFSTLDWLVVIVYLVSMCGLGLYQARKIRSSGDYFAGGRRFSRFLMMMHTLGTGTHADDPVGVAGAAYERGFSGIWYTFVYLFVTPFYWIIAPVFRRSRFLTSSDFFQVRFGNKLSLLYAVMSVLAFTINIGTMLKGTALIARAVTGGAVQEWVSVVAMAVVFVAYGTAGGLIATVVTESVQGLLIVVMSLMLVPFGLMRIGGFAGLHHLVESAKFSLSSPAELSVFWIVAATIANLINIVGQPHTMEICAAGKTEWEGRVGFTYGAFIKRICALGWMLTGVIVIAMVTQGSIADLGDKRELAFGTAIRTLLPIGFTGLMFAAILAAQMSTLSAFMVAGSALISRNMYRQWMKPGATDSEVVKVARYAGLIIVAGGVVFAVKVPGVADAITYFWAVTSFTGLFMWFGVLWRRANATGAWISFAVMVTIWLLLGPVGMALHHYLPVVSWLGIFGEKAALPWLLLSYLPAGILAMVIGSLLSRPLEKKKLDDFHLLISTPVGEEGKLVEQGVEVVYAGNTQGHPWELKHRRLVDVLGFVVALCISLAFFGILFVLARIGG